VAHKVASTLELNTDRACTVTSEFLLTCRFATPNFEDETSFLRSVVDDSIGVVVPVHAAIRVRITSTVGGHVTILVARVFHFFVAELHVVVTSSALLRDELATLLQTPSDGISHFEIDIVPSRIMKQS